MTDIEKEEQTLNNQTVKEYTSKHEPIWHRMTHWFKPNAHHDTNNNNQAQQ